jgi:hypothetical protein
LHERHFIAKLSPTEKGARPSEASTCTVKYFNEVSVLYVFLTLDIRGINYTRLISRPIHAPSRELGDADTNISLAKVISKRFFTWTHLPDCKHGKLFIGGPCKKRADDLLKLDRHQIKLAVAILTEHVPVRGHLRIIGLFDGDPSCRFCGMETETVQHLVCHCEALSRQRYNVFGVLIFELKDLSTATVSDLCFIRNTGLFKLG